MSEWDNAFGGRFFDLPIGASSRDQIVGIDELGRRIYRSPTGTTYTEPDIQLRRNALAQDEGFWSRFGGAVNALAGGVVDGIVSGVTAPGRALAGEPVTYGDVMDTAGFAQLGGAAMPAPKGALRSGAVRNDGIRAYHGSPHDFDKFSLDKIGTGEGAQAYGHGLYFSDGETVARTYRDKVSAMLGNGDLTVNGRKINWDDPIEGAAFEVMRHGGDRAAAAEYAARTYRKGSPVADIIRSGVELPEVKSPGHMYEVKIKANPDDFLDWDKPLSEQPQRVRDAVSGIANLRGESGGFIWESLVKQKNAEGAFGEHMADPMPAIKTGPKAATEALRDAGIPGIKYLDAGSRGAGTGSRNYVVFDDNLLEILRKYGLAGATVGGAGLLAAPGDAQAAEIQNYLGLLPK